MIPEEDRGPAWLRDYGYTDFGAIEADIAAMEEFAAKLAADVTDNYAPHAMDVANRMTQPLPAQETSFAEMSAFIARHTQVQETTYQNVWYYGNGTVGLANAAKNVSEKYRGSDAFARATVTDVEKSLDSAGIVVDSEGVV